MLFKKALLVILIMSCAGCVIPYRRSPDLDSVLPQIKSVAVLPADVKVFKISAGGVSEEMDDWSSQAKANIETSLKKYLGKEAKQNFELKFITEDWLKANQKDLWRRQKAMYEAVAVSAIRHTYAGSANFPHKLENFDYTMGPDVNALAQALGAEALIFVNGRDNQETAGRVAVNFMQAVIVGYYQYSYSFFSIALVDGNTGALLWFNISSGRDYNFLNQKHIDSIVEWVTKDFIAVPK